LPAIRTKVSSMCHVDDFRFTSPCSRREPQGRKSESTDK
jgi:hypothetical protein